MSISSSEYGLRDIFFMNSQLVFTVSLFNSSISQDEHPELNPILLLDKQGPGAPQVWGMGLIKPLSDSSFSLPQVTHSFRDGAIDKVPCIQGAAHRHNGCLEGTYLSKAVCIRVCPRISNHIPPSLEPCYSQLDYHDHVFSFGQFLLKWPLRLRIKAHCPADYCCCTVVVVSLLFVVSVYGVVVVVAGSYLQFPGQMANPIAVTDTRRTKDMLHDGN
ncbi:hypothetical protein Tco_1408721 [Tanacetum coccineum]